jgi:hypothetical protein
MVAPPRDLTAGHSLFAPSPKRRACSAVQSLQNSPILFQWYLLRAPTEEQARDRPTAASAFPAAPDIRPRPALLCSGSGNAP